MTVRVHIDLERVRLLKVAGLTLRAIAAELGVSYSTLSDRTARAGLYFISTNRGARKRARLERQRQAAEAARRAHKPKLDWTHYLAAACEEETMPHYLRGRADVIRDVLERRARA